MFGRALSRLLRLTGEPATSTQRPRRPATFWLDRPSEGATNVGLLAVTHERARPRRRVCADQGSLGFLRRKREVISWRPGGDDVRHITRRQRDRSARPHEIPHAGMGLQQSGQRGQMSVQSGQCSMGSSEAFLAALATAEAATRAGTRAWVDSGAPVRV